MTRRISRLEAKLRHLIESSTNFLFSRSSQQPSLSKQILQALHNSVQTDADGLLAAADRYIVFIHPSQENFFFLHSEIPTELADLVRSSGEEAGYHFHQSPSVGIQVDVTLAEKQFYVQSVYQNGVTPTFGIPVTASKPIASSLQTAFLIVNGTDTFNLSANIVNIGRRSDNHLVINDPRISRRHAQLRWINGRYIIFDLDSSGGTKVNGNSIHQQTLAPGDVISLGGVPLVFGQELGDETDPLVI